MAKLTQKRLKELLHYDPETGVFTWKIRNSRRISVGDIAGSVHSSGYRYIQADSKIYKAARLAWLYVEGYWPEYTIDHKNRIRNDNRWINLRHATQLCNVRNRSVPKNNNSGIMGVSWNKKTKKWSAYIKTNNKSIYLGEYKLKKNASKARWEAEKKYGWPDCNTTSAAFVYLKENGAL